MRKMIVHRQAVVNRLINNTRPFIVATTVGSQNIQNAPYNVINTSSTIPGAGQLLIPPSGLTIRISEWDADAVNHHGAIATLVAGDIIYIGESSCVVAAAPIWNTDYFSIFVEALPVVVDGLYLVTVVRTEPPPPLLIPAFTNATHEYVEGTLSLIGEGAAFPADNDDGSFSYVFDNTGTTASSDGYATLDGYIVRATSAAISGPPNSFGTPPNTYAYTVRATSEDGTGTGTITLHCLESVPSEDPIITTAKAILANYGANAHVWVAGIDSSSGYPANNCTDTAGTVPAIVGNAVAFVGDATSTADATQVTVGNRPTLQVDGNGKYYWDMSSDMFNITGQLVDFIDQFVVIGGVFQTTALANAVMFAQGNSAAANNGNIRIGTHTTGAGFLFERNNANVPVSVPAASVITSSNFVLTGQRVSSTVHNLFQNLTKATNAAGVASPVTTNQTSIGGRLAADTGVPGLFWNGRIYCVIVIKGDVPDADLRSLQDYVALLSGVTL